MELLCFEYCSAASKTTPTRHTTVAVAQWLEHLPREREYVGSIPGRDRPKSLKVVVVASPLGAQDYWNSTATCPLVSG